MRDASLRFVLFVVIFGVGLGAFASSGLLAQVVLFADDFEDGIIDSAKWRFDDRPFETGAGDFEAVEAGGTLTIAGEGNRNWWGGFALATIPTFSASSEVPLTFEVERVAHERVDNVATGAGANSSTRTSIWMTNADRSSYVFFSQNSNEGGWTFNKRVGDLDDNATGAGSSVFEFDPVDADFGSHVMRMVANGGAVQLFLDDVAGPVVNFPFSEGIVCEIGAYARRGEGALPTDSVTGVFDNVSISGAGEACVSLSPPFLQAVRGEGEAPTLTLQIPDGAARPATVTITSDGPDVAVPQGAVDGVLDVIFAAEDPPFRTVTVDLVGEGLATLSVDNPSELCNGDPVKIYVPGVLVSDDFEDGEIDSALWAEDDEPFEDGEGSYVADEVDGGLRLSGQGELATWSGLALVSTETFMPTLDSPVTFQIDQTLISVSTGLFRAGVWVMTPGREDWVFFSFVRGGAGDWVVNSTTSDLWPEFGEGLDLAAYNCCTFDALDVARRVELVLNGETVSVVMDGVEGGGAPFEFDEVAFGFGVYASGEFDSVEAIFDNARVLGPETGGNGQVLFHRSDVDGDGVLNLTDGVRTLNFLFLGGPDTDCKESQDVDNDGQVNITDGVAIFNFLFLGGPPPEVPGPTSEPCGPDPDAPGSAGDLGCEIYDNC